MEVYRDVGVGVCGLLRSGGHGNMVGICDKLRET